MPTETSQGDQVLYNSLSPEGKAFVQKLADSTAPGGLSFGPNTGDMVSPQQMAWILTSGGTTVPTDAQLAAQFPDIPIPPTFTEELLIGAALVTAGISLGSLPAALPAAQATVQAGMTVAGAAKAITSAVGTPAGNAVTAIGNGISAAASAAGNTGRANADTNAANQSLFQQELNNNAKTEATQRTGALSNLYRMNNITNPVSASDPFGSAGQQTFSPQYTSALSSLANQGSTMLAQPAKYAVNGPNMPTPTYTPYTPSALQTLGNVVGPVASVGGALLNGFANKGPASNGPAGTVTPGGQSGQTPPPIPGTYDPNMPPGTPNTMTPPPNAPGGPPDTGFVPAPPDYSTYPGDGYTF